MGTTMAALNSASIRFAEFVKLTLPSGEVTLCNAAGPITVDGTTFQGFGGLLGISDIQRDIKATGDDLSISLTGIDPTYVAIVLSQEIKGSKIETWRGFLDSDNQIITSPTQQFFKRYQGLVNNISINETFDEQNRVRVATCVLLCASFRTVLENRIAGVITNGINWKKLYPNDTSMDRVQSIVAQYFDFGKAPKRGSQSTANGSATTAGTSEAPDSGGGA